MITINSTPFPPQILAQPAISLLVIELKVFKIIVLDKQKVLKKSAFECRDITKKGIAAF